MEYIKVSQAAKKWEISSRRVRQLCAENRIEGVSRKGNFYMIPADSPKPADERSFRGKDIPPEFSVRFMSISAKKEELDRRCSLTEGELEHLRNFFLVDFTYNSNAIEGNALTLKETALVLEGMIVDQKPLQDHL